MDEVTQNIIDLDMKAVRNCVCENNSKVQGDTFQHLLSALKGKPKETHACAGKQLVYLLSLHGADVNLQMDSGNTPLQEYLGFPDVHPGVVEAFLRCNADVYAPNKDGRTAFALAYFNPRLAKTLKSVFMQYVPGLWRAVEGDDVMNVRKLVNQWCHTNFVKEGQSLIQLANQTGSENVVRVVRDIKLSMDLAHAVLGTDIHLAKRILTSGDKVNTNFHNMGDKNATPLYYAILNNDSDMVDLLLDHGARVDIPMSHDENEIPLFMSVLSGHNDVEVTTLSRVVERLSKNTINKMFFMGSSLLLHCINHNVHLDLVENIVRKGGAALVTCRDQDNLTPRDIAELNEKMEYVELIDQVVSDWCFSPGAGDCNRRLLCLHAYPYISRVPKLPSCNFYSGQTQGTKQSCSKLDEFWDQLESYLHDIDRFHSAVENNDYEFVSQMIYCEEYAQHFEPCLADSRTKANFQPALHKAILRGNRDIMRHIVEAFLFLLGHRLDFVRDQFHRTVLYYAMAAEGSEDMVAYLAENGASEHVMDKDGRSPQVFKDRKDQPVMKEFLRYHLQQNFTDNEPNPWSVPLPVPIVGYIKKCTENHKHGHGFMSHHHHKKISESDSSMTVQPRAYRQTESSDSEGENSEESETESNQETDRWKTTDTDDYSGCEEQSSSCQIL